MTSKRRSSTGAVHLPRLAGRGLLALALAALLAACGGEDDGDAGPADHTPPTVTITDDVDGATATGSVTFTFTFSEDVGTSFVAADVTVAGGTKGTTTRVSGTVTTMVVVPTANAVGTITVTVPAGAFSDLAGNASTAPATASQAYDTEVALAQMALPVTFDSATVAYGVLGFEGAEDSTIVVDPTDAGNHVVKVVKSATAQPWAGTTVTTEDGSGFATPLPFDADNTRMTVRVWSPDAGIAVRVKAEAHADPTKSVETEATTTLAGAWETLTFDFATEATGTAALDLANAYDKVSVFFNFGTGGATAGAKTYYFDDLVWIGGGGTGGGEPAAFATVTFDAAGVSYALVGFEGAEASTIVQDPTDASNHVARVVKTATAQPWAGTTVVTQPNNAAGRLPFDAANTRMTVRVWSPDAGIPVRLKVEDSADAGRSAETEATVTTAAGWQTLTFDFANPASGTAALNLAFTYDKVSVFFNFGTGGATAGEKTYYFDDVTFIGGGGIGGGTPFETVTFDAAGVTYTLTGFGGADDSTVVVDPTDAGNHVARVLKSATAETWAGTTVSTQAGNKAGRIAFTATRTRMSVRVWSPDAGIQVRLKVEDASDATHSVETEATVTTAAGWQTLTFDFASQAPGTAALNLAYTYDRASIFFNFGTSGATAGAKTYYFDDVTFVP